MILLPNPKDVRPTGENAGFAELAKRVKQLETDYKKLRATTEKAAKATDRRLKALE